MDFQFNVYKDALVGEFSNGHGFIMFLGSRNSQNPIKGHYQVKHSFDSGLVSSDTAYITLNDGSVMHFMPLCLNMDLLSDVVTTVQPTYTQFYFPVLGLTFYVKPYGSKSWADLGFNLL